MPARIILFLLFFHFTITSNSQIIKEPHSAAEVQQWYSSVFKVAPNYELELTDSIRNLHIKTSTMIFKNHYVNGGGSKGKSKTFYDEQGRTIKSSERYNDESTGKQTSLTICVDSKDGKKRISTTYLNGKLTSSATSLYD